MQKPKNSVDTSIMGMKSLSEQAKSVNLPDESNQSNGEMWLYYLIGVVGLGLVFLLAPIIGIPFVCIGFAYGGYCQAQHSNIVKQKRFLGTTIQACTNCKKELPKGSFDFCPFCGKSLKF